MPWHPSIGSGLREPGAQDGEEPASAVGSSSSTDWKTRYGTARVVSGSVAVTVAERGLPSMRLTSPK